jgi:hypothetical protein
LVKPSLRALVGLFALCVAVIAIAAPQLSELIERLENGGDFRVRVQAALELGRIKDTSAREPLEKALDDKHASVRAAAAAALEKLGDVQALPALRLHRLDASPAVRRQVREAIVALEMDERKQGAKVLIKLGVMRTATTGASSVVQALTRASRSQLSQLPEVHVLEESEDADTASNGHKLPVVLVTGRVQKLQVSRQGRDVTYSAKVEYVLHRMPEQAIMGKVSGSASATASEAEVRDKRKRAELRQAVLDAAVASAVRRTPAALQAVARL